MLTIKHLTHLANSFSSDYSLRRTESRLHFQDFGPWDSVPTNPGFWRGDHLSCREWSPSAPDWDTCFQIAFVCVWTSCCCHKQTNRPTHLTHIGLRETIVEYNKLITHNTERNNTQYCTNYVFKYDTTITGHNVS